MSPILAPRAQDIVPSELAHTNREVLLLLYGIAAGAERPVPRAEYRGYVGSRRKVRARHDGATRATSGLEPQPR